MTTDSQIPDPNGAPLPSPAAQKAIGAVSAGFILAVGGVAAFLAVSATARPTAGALRSQRVKWDERRLEAFAEAQALDQAPADVQDGVGRHD